MRAGVDVWLHTEITSRAAFFPATSSAAGLAQSYLDAVNAGSGTPQGWTFYTFTSPDQQDYLSAEHTVPLRTVPEPGTLILLCSAVLAAWATALHRRQTA